MTVDIMRDGVLVSLSDEEAAIMFPPAPVLPKAVPENITRLQGRLALLAAGLLDGVEAAVAASDKATQIWYEDDPILARLATALRLTDDQVDALFVAAAAE